MNWIDTHEGKLERQKNRFNELEGEIALPKNMLDQLEIKFDDNEQYSGCTSIGIHGILVPENKSNDNVMAVVKSCQEKIYVPFDQGNVDRAYRVGNKCTDKNIAKKI